MKFGEHDHPSIAIKSARESVGMSREGLADRAGLSLRTIERIEAGTTKPHRATLVVIENALAERKATA